MLASRPTLELKYHPFLAIRDCLFNIFAATLHVGGRSSIRNLWTRNAVLTGTLPLLSAPTVQSTKIRYWFLCIAFCHCDGRQNSGSLYETCSTFASNYSRSTSIHLVVVVPLKAYTGCFMTLGLTAGGDFLGLCDQKSSCKHVSDFGRLRSYDRLKLRIEGNDY